MLNQTHKSRRHLMLTPDSSTPVDSYGAVPGRDVSLLEGNTPLISRTFSAALGRDRIDESSSRHPSTKDLRSGFPGRNHGTLACHPRHLSHNQNPVLKWSTQNHVKNSEGGRSYFWLGLSLANLHLPGFDCGSYGVWSLHDPEKVGSHAQS